MAVAQLNLAYTGVRMNAAKPREFPPLTAFLPDMPSEPVEPKAPLSFSDWARALLPLAGGRV